MTPTRTFSKSIGKSPEGDHSHTITEDDPMDSLTVIKNDSTEAVTDTTNESEVVSYKDICKIENLELGLKRTKSGVTAGLDGEVKATYTTSKLEKLAGELKNHSFKASPIKKV